MSVYNGLPFLKDAVESILSQTYSEFEFIIIDDASTDGSRELIRECAAQDSRIRPIYHSRNQGLGYSLNAGVRLASGELIARMDDDDISFPDRLEKQIEYLNENPEVDVLSGWAQECDGDMNPTRMRQVPVAHADIKRLIWTIPFVHPAVMFRKESILRVGSYSAELRRRQDYDLWFRCSAAGLTFANLPEPLIYYRVTEDYHTKNNFRRMVDQARIGWSGCKLVGASPAAYIGVAAPMFRAMLPGALRTAAHRMIHFFDPRRLA